MEIVNCTRCKGVENEGGCSECGGYGFTKFERKCDTKGCTTTGWFRPGAITMYEGKRLQSDDKKSFFYHTVRNKGKIFCEQCEEKKYGARTRKTKS